ncbi:lactonase family protein [Sporolactobacillus inulinus]|jgi:6-phosphogluconolactonase|uniref:6-phosphogluconolactonase n=1 Tax=Sporolactobacillus inulinus CASD TaxID=1069536 RepID=A0A0U1QRX3_9BACL|nr:lactonase family protein [Sporolactobacillus inulinus]KLI03544.1 6-phosphogluconolactonase [Sporolactobacillus inulinus CASD]
MAVNERGYIGTYTKGKSEGIYSFILDTERKVLTDLRCAAKLDNPTYVAIDKKNAKLYSVVKDGARGGVAAYAIDEAGALQLLGESVREGSSPCYVSVNQEGGRILDGNYHEGTASSYVPDSALGLRHQAGVQHEGSSAHRERQEGPHVHFADFTPDGRFAVTVDLGTDTLITYRVMEREWQENSTLVFKPGTGPRHLIFHPKAPYAYVMTELSNEVIALHFDLQSGTFTAIQTVNALPADFNGHSQGAAIKISADGRFVYVSNRGHNSIATFQVDEGSGRLALIEHTDTLGDWPRDIEIDPSGCFLIAANQNSGDVVLFERDPVNGTLTDLNAKLYVPDAVCVKFFGGR